MKNYAHLKHHPSDWQWIDVLGVGIFAHLGVGGFGTKRSIGVPYFQVRETARTWDSIGLIESELFFQVRIYSRT